MQGGIYEGTDLADKTFYGVRLNNKTGHCDLEIIRNGESPIVMPRPDVIDADDYKAHFWSANSIKFQWGPNGHLHMVVL